MAALEAAGVDRIYLQWLDLADFEGLAATVDVMSGMMELPEASRRLMSPASRVRRSR